MLSDEIIKIANKLSSNSYIDYFKKEQKEFFKDFKQFPSMESQFKIIIKIYDEIIYIVANPLKIDKNDIKKIKSKIDNIQERLSSLYSEYKESIGPVDKKILTYLYSWIKRNKKQHKFIDLIMKKELNIKEK